MFRLLGIIQLAQKSFQDLLVGWLVRVFSLFDVFIILASLLQHCQGDEEVIWIFWGLLRWQDVASGGDDQDGQEGGDDHVCSVT